MSTTVRAVGAGLFFLLIFLSGFWLSHAGKPYNGIIFNIHKLIGLAAGVFLGIVVYQVHRAAPLGPAQVAALVVAVLLTVATVAAGGLASLSTPMPTAFLTLHRLLPYLTTLSVAATLYLLLSRKM